MTDRTRTGSGHFHAVKFYDTQESLCRIVADFLGEGLNAREPILVIATPEHRQGIVSELRARHFNIEEMEASGDLLLIDASEMLATFVVDGLPDAKLFFTNATSIIERLCREQKGRTIRAYGEMVDVLWKAGHEVAAIRLEMLWNELAATHAFALLCSYSMGSFYKDASLAQIHHEHSHVVLGGDIARPTSRRDIN